MIRRVTRGLEGDQLTCTSDCDLLLVGMRLALLALLDLVVRDQPFGQQLDEIIEGGIPVTHGVRRPPGRAFSVTIAIASSVKRR